MGGLSPVVWSDGDSDGKFGLEMFTGIPETFAFSQL